MRVCGLCGAEYGEDDRFCPVDGSPLRATAPSPSERILVDRYQLKGKIGSGGFGVVLEAEDLRLRKRVAVKLLGPRVASNPEALARFEREAMAAAQIGHKGIIDVTDFDRDANGVPFLVMEHLDGADLSAVLASEKTLTVPRSLRIALQIAHALGAAHARGIVHRDLKPSNIFLSNFGAIHDVVKILDFGIARAAAPNEDSRLTGQWQIIGTPEYMAPEQAENPLTLDHRADIYALGCILYKLLVGRPPYVASTRMGLLRAHAQEKPLPPSVAYPDIPAELDDLVLRALAKDPAYRYPNMRSFAEAIRAHQGEDAATPPMGFPATSRGAEGDAPRDPAERSASDTLRDKSSTLGMATGESLPELEQRPHDGPPQKPMRPDAAKWPAEERATRRQVRGMSPNANRKLGRTVVLTVVGALLIGVAAWVYVAVRAHRTDGKQHRTASRKMAALPPDASPATTCPDDMLRIGGGEFHMGSAEGRRDEQPPHQVTLPPYCMDRTEVTVRAYQVCAENGPCTAAETGAGCHEPGQGKDDHPANCVSWTQAETYCGWMRKRLPTEAEWELGASGIEGRKYPWGRATPGSQLCWRGEGNDLGTNKRAGTCRVGSYPQGASPYGLEDMAGNVVEWVSDCYRPYTSAVVHPVGSCENRVVRGGNWEGIHPSRFRGAARHGLPQTFQNARVGFRCARGVE